MADEESFKDWFKRRRKALDLTQDELADKAGCSISTIQAIEQGTLRPSRQLAELLATGLDIPPAERADFVRRARATAGRSERAVPAAAAPAARPVGPRGVAPAAMPPTNPYKGLRAFQESDAPDFFGRESLTEQLHAQLTKDTELARFLAVVGPSGSGKSSVVRAGLVPALRRQVLPGGLHPVVVDIIPGPYPLEELDTALVQVAATPIPSLMELLRADERGLARAVKRVLPRDAPTGLVLVIDQFEELFTLVDDEKVRTDFLDGLFSAVTDPRLRLWVVVTLRADFYDRPLLYRPSSELLGRRTEVVGPLTPHEMYRAITGPAQRAGLEWESDLVATIMQDIGEQPGTLPLLQYTLTELYERREGHRLTLAAYRASGGVFGSLARRAESLYAALTEQEQAAARQLFLRLVTVDEGVEGTRRRVVMSELVSAAKDEAALRRVLDLFGRYRMLTYDRHPLSKEPTVEVAHEALLRTWGRLGAWLDASRDDLRVQRQLLSAAAEWRAAGQHPSYLARGARLAQFADLAAKAGRPGGLALTAAERTYLDEGLNAEMKARREEEERKDRELALARQAAAAQRRAATWLRVLVGVLGVFLLAAGGFAAVLFNLREIAETGRVVAERQARVDRAQALAAQAIAQLTPDPELSLLLALEAVSTTRRLGEPVVPQAEDALRQVLLRSPLLLTLRGHAGAVNGAAWSPDGAQVATAGDDGTVRIWERATGRAVLVLRGHAGPVHSVAWSPDGARIAGAGSDQVVRLWDAASGAERASLATPGSAVYGVTYSPDGARLLTAGGDGVARLWDTRTGQEVLTLTQATGRVQAVAFSPDGRRLAATSEYGPVQLWDAVSGRAGPLLANHAGLVYSVAYSRDGSQILTAGRDGTVRLWEATTGREVAVVVRDPNWPATGAVYSPDGLRIVTTSWSGKTSLWDARTRLEVGTLYGHRDQVLSVAYSPDGRYFITTSRDGAAKIWQTALGQEGATLRGHTGNVWTAAYSPDGGRIVTASADGTARLWDAATGQELRVLRGHINAVNSAAYSPDGRRIVTAGGDNMAKIWDAAGGQELATLQGHTTGVLQAAYSPDGLGIATASVDGTARLWDAATAQVRRILRGHTGAVTSVAYSPDGRWVVTSDVNGATRIWDAATGQERALLRGHAAAVYKAVFSPDGSRLVTASWDATAKIWAAEAPTGPWREWAVLSGHGRGVRTAAYSPDGRWIVSASADETARIWDAQGAGGIHLARTTLQGHSDRVWSAAWSADGRRIITASSDGTARQYLADPGALVALATARAGRTLTAEERAIYLAAPLDLPPATPAAAPTP